MATLQTLPEATTIVTTPHPAAGVTTLAARSFFYAVFKHRFLVLAAFALIFAVSTVAALLRPRTWRADTKVLVKLGETAQLAPAESPSRSIGLPLSQEVVKTEAEIVKSGAVIREAVERVGVKPEPGTSFEEMVANMQTALTVTPSPGANVLRISYLGKHPERASRMVNAITDVYLEHHNQVYQPKGIQDFYSAQLKVLDKDMKDAQHKLRRYLKEANIVDIDQELQLLNQDFLEQQKNMKLHHGKIRGFERKLAEVRAQLARTPTEVQQSEEYLSNPTIQTFKNQLAQLEIERYQALQAYMPSDRHVQDKEQAIARIKARIAEESGKILNKQTVRHSELYDELLRISYAHEVTLADLRAREPGIGERLKSASKRLRELRDQRFIVANLKQDSEDKTYAYELYRKKRQEAAVQEAMTNQSMVNVSVVEHATPPIEPENGLLLPIIMGLIGGLAIAAGLAVAVEYLNRRLRFEEEVERYLELPVLAVIPDLETTATIGHA
jgi:uncharacterized protein involved in exopolysaccharide biosynthesis